MAHDDALDILQRLRVHFLPAAPFGIVRTGQTQKLTSVYLKIPSAAQLHFPIVWSEPEVLVSDLQMKKEREAQNNRGLSPNPTGNKVVVVAQTELRS